jgi:hypothetical protein
MASEGLKAGSKMKSRSEFRDSVSEGLLGSVVRRAPRDGADAARLALCGSRRYITGEFPHIALTAR